MTINQLETYLSQRLANLTDIQVYNKKPSDLATFPYVIFKITGITHMYSGMKTAILELDFWNDDNDDTTILSAAESILNGRTVDETFYIGLGKSTQDELDGFYKSDIEFESFIPDTEKGIVRYNQRYVLKVV